MKFKYRFQHKARDKTMGEEVTARWQDLIFLYKNARGVWKEVRK